MLPDGAMNLMLVFNKKIPAGAGIFLRVKPPNGGFFIYSFQVTILGLLFFCLIPVKIFQTIVRVI